VRCGKGEIAVGVFTFDAPQLADESVSLHAAIILVHATLGCNKPVVQDLFTCVMQVNSKCAWAIALVSVRATRGFVSFCPEVFLCSGCSHSSVFRSGVL